MSQHINLMTQNKFRPKDYSYLMGTKGFSDVMLNNHFKLYEGYVKNTNTLSEEINQIASKGNMEAPAFGELKRRFGWEYNGMRLHELYFENFGPKEEPLIDSSLKEALRDNFISMEKWKDEFLSTAAMRGVGWVVLYKDPLTTDLFICWIDEHNNGHLVGSEPILVLDVFEHAYITDYGLNRGKYLSNFYEQINWEVVTSRFS